MKGYVYKYTSPSGKSYIGITKNLKKILHIYKMFTKRKSI